MADATVVEPIPFGPITREQRAAGRMPLTKAERSARWRLRHPDRVTAYQNSDRKRELSRYATRRYRAKHPKERKPLPAPVDLNNLSPSEQANYMRGWKARISGFADCLEFPPPPANSKCQNCGVFAKLHLDHDHKTGAFRGWLCLQCNMGIGQLGDDVAGLESALAYLTREGNHG